MPECEIVTTFRLCEMQKHFCVTKHINCYRFGHFPAVYEALFGSKSENFAKNRQFCKKWAKNELKMPHILLGSGQNDDSSTLWNAKTFLRYKIDRFLSFWPLPSRKSGTFWSKIEKIFSKNPWTYGTPLIICCLICKEWFPWY